MKNTFIVAILLLVIAVSGFSQSPNAYVRAKGSSVSVIPPENFLESDRFSGFINAKLTSSIYIAEFFNGTFDDFAKAYTKENLATKNIELLTQKELTVDDKRSLLVEAKQIASGVVFGKWLLLVGTKDKSVLLTATYPEKFKNQVRDKLLQSLLTLKWNPETMTDALEGINFTFSETSKLKISNSFSKNILLTLNGEKGVQEVEKPLFLIGQAYSTVLITDRKKYSEVRATKQTYTTEIEIIDNVPIAINGLNGFVTTFHSKDKKTARKVFNYQVMLYEDDTYFILLGTVAFDKKELYLEDFEKIVQSFRSIDKNK